MKDEEEERRTKRPISLNHSITQSLNHRFQAKRGPLPPGSGTMIFESSLFPHSPQDAT